MSDQSLTYLNLLITQVPGAGLLSLKGLTRLAERNIDGTRITKDGMRSLLRDLPVLKIYRPEPRS